MVEHQIICKILEEQSLKFLLARGIGPKDFINEYIAVAEFIYNHYAKYGRVPDKLTFLANFDLDLVVVTESEDYLIETMLTNKVVETSIVHSRPWAEAVQTNDPQRIMEETSAILHDITSLQMKSLRYTDISKDEKRLAAVKKRMEMEGLIGLSTGIEPLDKMLNGLLTEDFIVILARTNVGKSWLLLFILVAVWKSGKDVFLYSGEMSSEVVGLRFDTVYKNFNQSDLMNGDKRILEEYEAYFAALSETGSKFIVVTPKDLGGNRLDIPKLHGFIEMFDPAVIGIDQLSLMEDYRTKGGDQPRTKYTHIAEDLYSTSEKYGKPILAPSQANREADKKGDDDDIQTPELSEIAESDGVGQNATRVLSMAVNGNMLKIQLRKNRYGKRDESANFLWDVEVGVLKPMSSGGGSTNPSGRREGTPPPVIQQPPKQTQTAGSEIF